MTAAHYNIFKKYVICRETCESPHSPTSNFEMPPMCKHC